MVSNPYYAFFLTMPIIVSFTYALHALFMLLLLNSKDLFLSLYNFSLKKTSKTHVPVLLLLFLLLWPKLLFLV
jgi:hypothetical protein